MKVVRIGEPEIVMQNPDSTHNYFAWPTATRLQNGKIAVVASGFRMKHVCPFGKTVISYSENEGKTYTLPAPVIDTPLDDRDGGIMTFGESGVIVTSFNNDRKLQRRYFESAWLKSVTTWINNEDYDGYIDAYLGVITDEIEDKYLGSLYRVSNDCGVTFGPIRKCPVSSPHGPCVLPDGTILYVGTVFEHDSSHPCANILKAYTVDAEGNCEYRGTIDPVHIEGERMFSYEPHAFVLDDGTVICHLRVEGSGATKLKPFATYQTVSKDGGRTWTAPQMLTALRGGAPAHIMKHSSGTLISVVGYRDMPFGIKAMFSRDNGETWDIGYDIYSNEVSHDIGYPSTVELSDGSLLTVFYARIDEDSPAVIMQQRWRLEE